MGGKLTGHLDVDYLERLCIDAECRNVNDISQLAQQLVRKETGLLGSQDNNVEDYVLIDECNNGKNKDTQH